MATKGLQQGVNAMPIVSSRNTSIPHPLPHHIIAKNHGNLSCLVFVFVFFTILTAYKKNK